MDKDMSEDRGYMYDFTYTLFNLGLLTDWQADALDNTYGDY